MADAPDALSAAILYAPERLDDGIAILQTEPVFQAILERAGPPRFRRRRHGFEPFLHISLQQQVSIHAAAAMFRRLGELCRPLTPASFLTLDDATLRICGFSRQKAGYGRALAEAVISGDLDLDRIGVASDDEVL